MSVSIDDDCEACDVWEQRRHKSNGKRRCDACRADIPAGHVYVKHTIWCEAVGREMIRRCLACDTIYQHLVERLAGEYYEAADPRLDCGHEYEERWNEAPPDELARIAFMTPDEVQSEFAERK